MKKVSTGLLSGTLAVILSIGMTAGLPGIFNMRASAAAVATVQASTLNMRSGAGTGHSKVKVLPHGASVSVLEEVMGEDGKTWAKISYQGSEGYVQKSYLRAPVSYTRDEQFESQLAAEGFPESYKEGLRQIHAQYPNWVFRADHTGLGWEEVISNESVVGRNLVDTNRRSSWKSTADGAFDWAGNQWPGFDSSAWVAASEGIIRYYMDPRNFLDSAYVFQFLTQSYDAATQSAGGVEALAKGTFLEGQASSGTATSAEAPLTPDGAVPGGGSTQLVGPSGEPFAQGTATDQSQNGAAEQNTTETTVGNAAGPGAQSADSSSLIGIISAAPQRRIEDSELSGTASGAGERASAPELLDTLKVDSRAVVVRGSRKNAPESEDSNSVQQDSQRSDSGVNYIDIILRAAEQSGVNPYVLSSMIIQEQGSKGRSGLISGTNSSYPGIYNFFNVQAYSDGSMSATTRGLWWASQSGSYGRPWNSIERAIIGGAEYYGENFIKSGQDTFYLKKFNITAKNRYQHQYMTNVEGAASEGFKLGEAYNEDLKQNALVFRIPVYSGMPDTPSAAPEGDGSPNNKLSSLTAAGFSITPSFQMNQLSYDLIVDRSVSHVNLSAEAIDHRATIEGTGDIYLSDGTTTVTVRVTAENGEQRSYVLNISRQDGAQTGNNQAGESQSDASGGPGVGNTRLSGTASPDGEESAVGSAAPGEVSGSAALVAPSEN